MILTETAAGLQVGVGVWTYGCGCVVGDAFQYGCGCVGVDVW